MSGTKDNPVVPASSSVFELPRSTFDVIDEVMGECERQDGKWGEQHHNPANWFAILGEEFGEVAKEVVGVTFAHPVSTNYRTELVQTAAVAVRMVESYDRWLKAYDAAQRRGVPTYLLQLFAMPTVEALKEFEHRAMTDPWFRAALDIIIQLQREIDEGPSEKGPSAAANERLLRELSAKMPPITLEDLK